MRHYRCFTCPFVPMLEWAPIGTACSANADQTDWRYLTRGCSRNNATGKGPGRSRSLVVGLPRGSTAPTASCGASKARATSSTPSTPHERCSPVRRSRCPNQSDGASRDDPDAQAHTRLGRPAAPRLSGKPITCCSRPRPRCAISSATCHAMIASCSRFCVSAPTDVGDTVGYRLATLTSRNLAHRAEPDRLTRLRAGL